MKKSIKRILSFALVTAMAMTGSAFAANPMTYDFDDGSAITFSDVTKSEVVTLEFAEFDYNAAEPDWIYEEAEVTVVYLPDGATAESSTAMVGGYVYELDGGVWYIEVGPYFSLYGEVDSTTFGSYYDNGTYQLIQISDYLFMTTDRMLDDTVTETAEVEAVEEDVITAAPTASAVLVDGEQASFEAYNIADTNYFKLRDIAYILDGTEANFELTWNQEAGAIEILSATAYTAVGGEMADGDGTAKAAAESTAAIFLDGVEIEMEAYTINDNNYFKLRDLGEALGFNVTWDAEAGSIVIASDEEYTAD